MSSTGTKDGYDIEQISSVASAASDALWSQYDSTHSSTAGQSDSETGPACVLVDCDASEVGTGVACFQPLDQEPDREVGLSSHQQAISPTTFSAKRKPSPNECSIQNAPKTAKGNNTAVVRTPKSKLDCSPPSANGSATPQTLNPCIVTFPDQYSCALNASPGVLANPVLRNQHPQKSTAKEKSPLQVTHTQENDGPRETAKEAHWATATIGVPHQTPRTEHKLRDVGRSASPLLTQARFPNNATEVDMPNQPDRKRLSPPRNLDLNSSKKRCSSSDIRPIAGMHKQSQESGEPAAVDGKHMPLQHTKDMNASVPHSEKASGSLRSNHCPRQGDPYSIRQLATASFEQPQASPQVGNRNIFTAMSCAERRNDDVENGIADKNTPLPLNRSGTNTPTSITNSGKINNFMKTLAEARRASSSNDNADGISLVDNERSWVDFLTHIGNAAVNEAAADQQPLPNASAASSDFIATRSSCNQTQASTSKSSEPALQESFAAGFANAAAIISDKDQPSPNQKSHDLYSQQAGSVSAEAGSDNSFKALSSCFRNMFNAAANPFMSRSPGPPNAPVTQPQHFSYPGSSHPAVGDGSCFQSSVNMSSKDFPPSTFSVPSHGREPSAVDPSSMMPRLPQYPPHCSVSSSAAKPIPRLDHHYQPSLVDYSMFNANMALGSPVGPHMQGMMQMPSPGWPGSFPYPPAAPSYHPYFGALGGAGNYMAGYPPSHSQYRVPQVPVQQPHLSKPPAAAVAPAAAPAAQHPQQHPANGYGYHSTRLPHMPDEPPHQSPAAAAGTRSMQGGFPQPASMASNVMHQSKQSSLQDVVPVGFLKSNLSTKPGTPKPQLEPKSEQQADEMTKGVDTLLLLMTSNASAAEQTNQAGEQQQMSDIFEKDQSGVFAKATSISSEQSLKSLAGGSTTSLSQASTYGTASGVDSDGSSPRINYPMDGSCEAVRKRRSAADPNQRAKKARRSAPLVAQASVIHHTPTYGVASSTVPAPLPHSPLQQKQIPNTIGSTFSAASFCQGNPCAWTNAGASAHLYNQHTTAGGSLGLGKDMSQGLKSTVDTHKENSLAAQAASSSASSEAIDQIISLGNGTTSGEGALGDMGMMLLNASLWHQFHMHCTEMIVTRQGRKIFPRLQLEIRGLKQDTKYSLHIVIAPMDSTLWRWQGGRWIRSGQADTTPHICWCSHQDSPNTGRHWMQSTPIVFDKVRLSNNRACSQHPPRREQILVQTMRRYMPRILICLLDSREQPMEWRMVAFPETEFIPVTAYQNQAVIDLKVNHNPFAKGFRGKAK